MIPSSLFQSCNGNKAFPSLKLSICFRGCMDLKGVRNKQKREELFKKQKKEKAKVKLERRKKRKSDEKNGVEVQLHRS